MFDQRARDHGLVYAGPVAVTEATTLTPEQTVVHATPAGTNYDITLPPVAECIGRVFSITSIANAVGTVSVVGAGDEAAAYAPSALTTTNDRLLCVSDGLNWNTISTVAT